MKTIRVDVTNIQTVRALHVYLAYVLDLPAHYGRNLDALHDVLCEKDATVRIVLCGRPAGEEMEAYLPRLEAVLQDCAEDNTVLCFERA